MNEKELRSKDFAEGAVMYRTIGKRNTCKCWKCGKVLKDIEHSVLSNHKQPKGVRECDTCHKSSTSFGSKQSHVVLSDCIAKSVKPHIVVITTNNENVAKSIHMHGITTDTKKGFYHELKTDIHYTRKNTTKVVLKALRNNAKVTVNGEVVTSYEEWMELTKA